MKLRLLLIGTVLVLPGCNLLFPETPNETETALKAFSSEEEFRNYFRSELATRNNALADQNMLFVRGDGEAAPEADSATGGAPAPSSPGGDQALADEGSRDHSQTTTQEVGVDEADVVKTDGEFIYLIDDSTGERSTLRIVRANPANQLAVVAEVALDGYGREIYLHEGKVVALTATWGGPVFLGEPGLVELRAEGDVAVDSEPGSIGTGVETVESVPVEVDGGIGDGDSIVVDPIEPGFAPYYRYERPTVTATVIDVTDPANARVLSKTKFDGSPSSNRMIDGMLHLVIANYQNYYFDVMPRLGMADFDPGAVDIESLLPRYEQTDANGNVTSGELVSWQDVYHPVEPDGFGVVTIVSLDANNGASLRATGVVAEPGLIYSSLNALYLTNTSYDYTGLMRTTTKIYKLAYADGRAVPSAAGSVSGRILNQYSMGEHNGFLRVATTVDPVFSPEGTVTRSDNSVYCLSDASGALEVVGRIEGIAPGETIQSARFVGDRGFVVTFEQIDPLFTLDLSDPTNPRIIGELKVPGFSTFMVPLDGNHILAVGTHIPEERFGPWGVQLSVFDVTDFANPVQKHNVVVGEADGAWSEALYDPKALTFYAEQGLVALPIYINAHYDITPFPVDVIEEPTSANDETKSDGTAPSAGTSDGGSSGADAPPVGTDEPEWFEGLLVYRVSADAGFTELGRISTRYENPGFYSWTSFTRGVFIGDLVYAVSNLGVRAASVADVGTIAHELFYGTQYPIDPFPIPIDIGEPVPIDGGDAVDGAMGAGGGSVGSSTGVSEGSPDEPVSSPRRDE